MAKGIRQIWRDIRCVVIPVGLYLLFAFGLCGWDWTQNRFFNDTARNRSFKSLMHNPHVRKIARYTPPGDTSGFFVYSVMDNGDTLAYYVYGTHVTLNPAGPYTGIRTDSLHWHDGFPDSLINQWWCLQDIKINTHGSTHRPLHTTSSKAIPATWTIFDYDSSTVTDTPDSFQFWQHWKVQRNMDTLSIDRYTYAAAGKPYVELRYDFKAENDRGGDTIKIVWTDEPFIGPHFNSNYTDGALLDSIPDWKNSYYDVGWMGRYGLVKNEHQFPCSAFGYVGGFADIGNPNAACDTLKDGTSAAWDGVLAEATVYSADHEQEYLTGFIAFNPNASIVPIEFVFTDTGATSLSSFNISTQYANIDSTDPLDSASQRYLHVRTDTIILPYGVTRTLNFAVGMAYMRKYGEVPKVPEIKFYDGTVLTPPRYK